MTPHTDPEKHLQLFIKNRKMKDTGGIDDASPDIPIFTVDLKGNPLKQAKSCPSVDRC